MPNSTLKVVDPTPFDLAVIAVVETLDGNLHLLQKGYQHFKNKGELLDWLGIDVNHWGNIRNHFRHVPTRGRQASKDLIIDKLTRRFDVNRVFLETNTGPMFKSNILVAEADVIYKTRQTLEKENDKMAEENKSLRRRVKELEKLVEQQSQLIEAARRSPKKVRQKARQKG